MEASNAAWRIATVLQQHFSALPKDSEALLEMMRLIDQETGLSYHVSAFKQLEDALHHMPSPSYQETAKAFRQRVVAHFQPAKKNIELLVKQQGFAEALDTERTYEGNIESRSSSRFNGRRSSLGTF